MKRQLSNLFPVMSVAALCIAAPLFAESNVTKASVPFAFKVMDHDYPAGHYAVEQRNHIVTITNRDTGDKTMVISKAGATRNSEAYKLTFHRIGDRMFLSSVDLPGSDESYGIPSGKLEKELKKSNAALATIHVPVQ